MVYLAVLRLNATDCKEQGHFELVLPHNILVATVESLKILTLTLWPQSVYK